METVGTSREQMKTSDHQVSIDIYKLGRSMREELENLHTLYDHQVSIDIYKLGRSMREELENLHPLSNECCIYRVPKRLRLLNEKAYTPQVVSIGPFHYGREELKAMEEHKRRYLKDFLAWTNELTVEDLIEVTKEQEARLRNCYAEVVELGSEDFVRMMLLDAAFVIIVVVKYCLPDSQSSNDRVFHRPWMIHDIRFDMILLENQLPFFFLEELFALCKFYPGHSMIKLTFKYLKNHWDSWVPEDILDKTNAPRVEHFVDFLRICQHPAKLQEEPKVPCLPCLPPRVERCGGLQRIRRHPPKLQEEPRDPEDMDKTNAPGVERCCGVLRIRQPPQKDKGDPTMPSVTELRQAGVRFQVTERKNLFDIKFVKNRGRLQIPRLLVSDDTETLLRNLQAFEQCYCCCDTYVADYINMINLLVRAIGDVEILVQNGIIENWLKSNDAVLNVLHNLDTENVFDRHGFYFSGIVRELHLYCRKPRHKWKATLIQNYFNNPWAIISVIAAGILLILTVIQTLCSVIQVTPIT